MMGSTSSGKSSTVTMDVDFSNVKPLTNFEVYSFMKKSTESKDRLRCQQTLFFTGLKYFNEKSPCICQAAEDIQKFLTDMKPFNLNKSELLALINNCPATHVELSVMIKDLDTRFTMPQIEEMLEKIASIFPDGIQRASQIASSGVAEENTE